MPSYDYSPAMKQANIIWTSATLDPYLTDPAEGRAGQQNAVPRTEDRS